MPDKDGKLTQEEKDRVAAWLTAKAVGDQRCPICGDPNWIIGDHIVQPITIGANNSLQLGGVGYPNVLVISQRCGYTRFVNAVIIGIAKTRKDEEKEKDGKDE